MSNGREQRILLALQSLQPLQMHLQNDSHKHIGHAGASDGRGHFSLFIVSSRFQGLTAVQRHKAIYGALAELLQTDIHALAIEARTPDEAAGRAHKR